MGHWTSQHLTAESQEKTAICKSRTEPSTMTTSSILSKLRVQTSRMSLSPLQRWCGLRSNVAVACCCRDVLECERHADEFGVVPGAAQKLEIDRLCAIIESHRKDDGWNTIRRARCVATAEAGPSA